jgi:hypothetical protein
VARRPVQVDPTAGFKLSNTEREIPAAVAMPKQESPETACTNCEQPFGIPVCTGEGVDAEAVLVHSGLDCPGVAVITAGGSSVMLPGNVNTAEGGMILCTGEIVAPLLFPVTVTGQREMDEMVNGAMLIVVKDVSTNPFPLERTEVSKGGQVTTTALGKGLGGRMNVHGGSH